MTDIPFEERVRQAKTRIREISAADAVRRHQDAHVTLVDVRELNEWNLFRIPGAVHVPLAAVGHRAAEIPRQGDVVLYCGSGNRSAVAADTLRELGYENVSSLAGGIRGWANAGGELED